MTTWTITHEYDLAGRRTETTYPSSNVVTRTHTPRGRLQTVSRGVQAVASFSYDAGNRETSRTHGNGLVTNRTYKPGENLVETITVVNRPSLSFEYTYDDNHNVTAESIGGVLSDYSFTAGYDDEDRLTSWERTNGDEQLWALSDVGNWDTFTENTVQQTRTHGPAHELTAIGTDPLSYDPKGNLTEDTNGLAYGWDFDNHLKQVTVPVGSPVGIEGTHTYQYDALGRRVAKVVDGVTTVFVEILLPIPPLSTPGGQTVAEYENGTLAREYAYGEYVDEPLVLVDRTDAGAVPAGTDEFFWYHQNRVYNVAGLSESSGAIVEHVVYTPHGGTALLTADASVPLASSQLANPWQFTARRVDDESELLYFRTRFFSARQGRFLPRDAAEYMNGAALYRAYFCPGGTDPSGLFGVGGASGARSCYDVCAEECYQMYQAGGFWRRSWIQYRMCLHTCASECRKLNDVPATDSDVLLAGTLVLVTPKPIPVPVVAGVGAAAALCMLARPVDIPIGIPIDIAPPIGGGQLRPTDPCWVGYSECILSGLNQHFRRNPRVYGETRCQECLASCRARPDNVWLGRLIRGLTRRPIRCDYWNFP